MRACARACVRVRLCVGVGEGAGGRGRTRMSSGGRYQRVITYSVIGSVFSSSPPTPDAIRASPKSHTFKSQFLFTSRLLCKQVAATCELAARSGDARSSWGFACGRLRARALARTPA